MIRNYKRIRRSDKMTKDYMILKGDCLDRLKELPDNSVDSVVTDPPYGLSKEPDIFEVLTKWINGEPYDHGHGGFMGKSWDSFVPHPDIWREVYRVLKPGGHALVFAGTRTQDLMTIALRLAGFEVRDVIEWLYFSGFPKSMDVSKAFDKKNGSALAFREEAKRFAAYLKERREAKGLSKSEIDRMLGLNTSYSWWEGRKKGIQPPSKENYLRLKPILDLDDRFDEFIERVEAEREKIGEKNYSVPKNHMNAMVAAEGAKGRVIPDITSPATELAKKWDGWGTALKPAHEPIIVVRKPLEGTVCDNVEKYGTGAINVNGCRIGDDEIRSSGEVSNAWREAEGRTDRQAPNPSVNTGRFPANIVTTEPDAFWSKYCNVTPQELSKKASKRDRNSDWRGEEIALPERESKKFDGGRFTRNGDGSPRKQNGGILRNTHPTVKPVDLMAWLVRLVTPPGGTVLDPFAGSGSTLVAAKREGFGFIGIERELEYVEIIEARTGEIAQ
jgi:DNA modification methylase